MKWSGLALLACKLPASMWPCFTYIGHSTLSISVHLTAGQCTAAKLAVAAHGLAVAALLTPASPCWPAAVGFQLSGGQCLQAVGFDSTSFWVLQVQPCSSDVLAQRFIVKDSIQQPIGSRVESLVATTKCLSYSLGETA